VRMTRHAISPRFAIKILVIAIYVLGFRSLCMISKENDCLDSSKDKDEGEEAAD